MAFSTNMRRVFFLLAAGMAALLAVNATQVMRRPEAFKNTPHKFAEGKVEPETIYKRAATGKVQAAYFTNW